MIQIRSRWSMTKVIFVVVIGLFLVPMMGNNRGEAADPIRMKFASYLGPSHPVAPVIQTFLKELMAASKGTVIIDYHGAEALGKAPENFDLVLEGLADMATVSCSYTPARFPLSSFVELPFFSTNARVAHKVAQALLDKKLITKEFEQVKLVCPIIAAPAQLFSNKPINKAEDFKGLRSFCAGPLWNKVMGGLGAQCVTMGMPDVYLALERGTLDVGSSSWAGARGWRWVEVVKFPTDIGLMGGFFNGIIMNKNSWSRLSPEVQTAWNKIFEKYGPILSGIFDDADEASKKVWTDAGKKINKFPEAEKEKLANLVMPVWQGWIDTMEKAGKPGKEIYKTYLKVMKDNGQTVVIKIPGLI
jgi:TRAP-type transport system periplasmic protein